MDRSATQASGRVRRPERAREMGDAFGLVLVLVVGTFVLTSLVDNSGWGAVAIMVATGATSIAGLRSAHVPTPHVDLAIYPAALGVLLAVVAAISGAHLWLNLGGIVQVGLLAAAMAAVLVRVITAGEVNARAIFGALSVYTVLGLLFGYAYETIARVEDSTFFEGVAHTRPGDFLFFSYTTLTTTGYGNLVPAGQLGEMIATFEMLVGQIFLVTLVAGLVARWRPGSRLRQRREERA